MEGEISFIENEELIAGAVKKRVLPCERIPPRKIDETQYIVCRDLFYHNRWFHRPIPLWKTPLKNQGLN
jgi:hypothetical protein